MTQADDQDDPDKDIGHDPRGQAVAMHGDGAVPE
jgi:hypothetical protein